MKFFQRIFASLDLGGAAAVICGKLGMLFFPAALQMTGESPRQLVLLGAGHANTLLMKFLIRWRPKLAGLKVAVTLVSTDPSAIYSGTIPAVVAGTLAQQDASLDVESLIPKARNPNISFRFIRGTAWRINPDERHIFVSTEENSIEIPYDVVSIDIGSSSRGLHTIPGALERVLPTRPLTRLLEGLASADALISSDRFRATSMECVVVGGGYAGCELAMCLRERWKDRCRITLITESTSNIPRVVLDKLRALRITIKDDLKAHEILDDKIVCSGAEIPADVVVFATGAAPHPFLAKQAAEGLAEPNFLTRDGYLAVDTCLSSVSHPDSVFGAGDCVQLFETRDSAKVPLNLPKAGVVPVRQSPTLIENVVKTLENEPISSRTRYVPQKSWLQILNCGDGTAIGLWGTWTFGPSAWVMKWKSWLDKRWMDSFA